MELKDKKVLVTGADGFIGSHLVEALIAHGAKVRAFVFYNSFNSWGWLDTFPQKLLDQIEIFGGDIRDADRVEKAVAECDVVFHLAAIIPIPFSYHSPRTFVETNITGTLNVLQASRLHNVKKILITSTSEVYGTAKYVPMDEEHPLQGQSPYSATKIGADHLAESFYRSFDTPVIIVRPFNTFGPRQSARAVIPTIITQLLSGAKKIKLGRLDTIRDFNYVKDVVRGFIEIARAPDVLGKTINIATGTGIVLEDVVRIITDIIGEKAEIAREEARLRPDKSEVERLIGSNKKIKQLTGWQPEYDFKRGLQETVAWFRDPKNLVRYKAKIYNL
ncbi:MAG: NAD-dependent 4,6-dehydratase LegB [bacterium]|nr:NAD-dependent 4,6-dehydratase LegB [bacterium]